MKCWQHLIVRPNLMKLNRLSVNRLNYSTNHFIEKVTFLYLLRPRTYKPTLVWTSQGKVSRIIDYWNEM